MRGGRPGTGARGGRPGVDTDNVAPDWSYYRVGTRTATDNVSTWPYPDRAHLWAMTPPTVQLGGAIPTASLLYALPCAFPRAGTIVSLANKQRSGLSTARGLRWGVYANVGGGGIYPGALIEESGEIVWANVLLRHTWAPSLSIQPGLYWLATLVDAGFASDSKTLDTLNISQCPPTLGVPGDLAGAIAVPACAVTHAQAYGPMPSTFPTSAPAYLQTGQTVPTAYYKWTDGV